MPTKKSRSKAKKRSGSRPSASPRAPVPAAARRGPAGGEDLPSATPSTTLAPVAKLPFWTVGIGASAGGLEALFAFLSAVPAAFGMAIVIVTHQKPDQKSLLPELLARRSALPVVAAADGVELEPNRVYVIPPGKNAELVAGVLRLSDPVHDGTLQLPIDFFFRSLAVDQEDRAVAIVLSGTGSDGSMGLRAVKGLGGVAFAQDQQSAEYPGMPLSAAATLLVDRTLPPEEMPAMLSRYARGIHRLTEAPGATPSSPPELVHTVLALLKQRSGHDFKGYKATAVGRRIERRMRVHQVDAVADYIALLESHPHELDLLFSDLLINVTSFFRDEEVFRALASLLGPRLGAASDESVRVWVAACSTGEEAYSLAILLAELGLDSARWNRTQVFATDIDPNVIEHARFGLYPEGAAADIGPERLERFFVHEDNGYRISKHIRERCVFAVQSVIKDPPFTKLDLLSCRNLLIYLDAETQQHLIALFHYALKPGGLLMLGTSETIGGLEQLFKPVDRRHKIYERLPQADASAAHDWHAPWPLPERAALANSVATVPSGMALHASKLLLERFAPPTLIVNGRGDIYHVHGRTGLYLELQSGEPQNNLLAMAREGLQGPLIAALRRAAKDSREVVVAGVQVRSDSGYTLVDVIVRRLGQPEALRGLFRVTFDSTDVLPSAPRKVPTRVGKSGAGRNTQLERELQRARGALQGSIEELQGSNEELKSMNEEMQSTNEELQSSNEELQTSKEEQNSMNEELQAVNLELQVKMDELSRTNDDMANLLESTDIATLFLDRNLRIKRFTELAREVINLIPGDIGRPVADLVSSLRYDRLTDDARSVLETLRPHEIEAQTSQGYWRLVRITPYRTSQNMIEGVAISFLDIDRVKRAEMLAASRALADSVVQTVHEPLAVLDENLKIASANPAFRTLFGVGSVEFEAISLFELGGGVFAAADMRALIGKLLADGTPFQDTRLASPSRDGTRRHLVVNARRLLGPFATPRHFLLALNERSQE